MVKQVASAVPMLLDEIQEDRRVFWRIYASRAVDFVRRLMGSSRFAGKSRIKDLEDVRARARLACTDSTTSHRETMDYRVPN